MSFRSATRWPFLGVILPAAVCASAALAQGPPLQVDVYQAITHDVSRPLPEMAKSVVTIPGPAQTVFLGRIPFTGPESAGPDGALQTQSLPTISTTPGIGFDGLGYGAYGFNVQYAPPDTVGAVGAKQYVQWVNTSFAVFNKSDGTLAAGPFPGKTLWQGFGGGCENNNDGDAIVQYDKLAQRWVFTQFSVSTKPYLQCFAVSTSENPLGPYVRFAFQFSKTDFPDYPKLGIWPNGWYMSFNIFRNGAFFSGPRACAVDRNKVVLAGGTPTMQCFQLSSSTGSLLPADMDGTTSPPANSPNYFVAFGSNSLQVWKFRPNFATPALSTFTGPTTLGVDAFTRACGGGTCIPQPVTTQKLDSLGDRVMYRAAYRNLGGTESLLINHSVQTSNAASGVRWYELRIANTIPTVYQQGTFSPDGVSRWLGSMAMDKCGNIALGYSVSSAGVYPGIRYTGRLLSDPPNLMETEMTVQDGSGYQATNLSRWGDYSAMNVDPVDDATFWFTTEYMRTSGTFNWNTRVASFKLGSCQ